MYICMLEGGGRTVGQILSGRRNPFPRESCLRPDCPLLREEGGCRGLCYKEGVGYSGHCTRCRAKQVEDRIPDDQAVDWSYQGETSRILFTRACQNLWDYSNGEWHQTNK